MTDQNHQMEIPFDVVKCFLCEKPLYYGFLNTMAGACPPFEKNVYQPAFAVLVCCTECHEEKIAHLYADERKRIGCKISFLAAVDLSNKKPS